VKKAKKRGAHRRRRPRKPMPGMMLHQDGSRHEWVAGQQWDLIVTMDDADSTIYSAGRIQLSLDAPLTRCIITSRRCRLRGMPRRRQRPFLWRHNMSPAIA